MPKEDISQASSADENIIDASSEQGVMLSGDTQTKKSTGHSDANNTEAATATGIKMKKVKKKMRVKKKVARESDKNGNTLTEEKAALPASVAASKGINSRTEKGTNLTGEELKAKSDGKLKRKSKSKLRMFLDTVSNSNSGDSDNVADDDVTNIDQESIKLAPDTDNEGETDGTEAISLYSNLESKENLLRRNSTFSLSGLSDTSDYTSDNTNSNKHVDNAESGHETDTSEAGHGKAVSDTEYNTKLNKSLGRHMHEPFIENSNIHTGNVDSSSSRVKFHAVRGIGAPGGRMSDSYVLKSNDMAYSEKAFDSGTHFGTMTDNLHLQYPNVYVPDPLNQLPKPPATLMHMPVNHVRVMDPSIPGVHAPTLHHFPSSHDLTPAEEPAARKFSIYHNPYKKYKKLGDYKPGRIVRHSDHENDNRKGLQLFGEIDPMQVKRDLGLLEKEDMIRTYNNPEAFDEFYSETDAEMEAEMESSVYYYSYDSDNTEKTSDSFDNVLRSLQKLKFERKKHSVDRKDSKSGNITEGISLDEAEETINEATVPPKSIARKKKNKNDTAQKPKVEPEPPVIPAEPTSDTSNEKKSKKSKAAKRKGEKKAAKKKAKSLDEDVKQTESKILDLDEIDLNDMEETDKQSLKSPKKKKGKKDKKGKAKEKKKTKRRSLSIESAKESDADDDSKESGMKRELESPNSELAPEMQVTSTIVNRNSVERVQARIEELKRLAEEEEGIGEGGEVEEGSGEAAADEEAPAEDEGPEPQIGIQYDPERQICLGDPIKIGTSVWAVDFANDKKFRKGKIVAFTEPATYTVKFGLFRRQPGTQRLDIQLKQPYNKHKKGLGAKLFSGSKDIYKCCETGDVQGVLDNILKDPDCVDKQGGKDKMTPLYYAAKHGHEEIIKVLLRYGAQDDDEGNVLKDADESVKQVLIEFGWGRIGAAV